LFLELLKRRRLSKGSHADARSEVSSILRVGPLIKERTAMNSNRSGRRYDREFKSNAVALVRGGRMITEVARDLGVSKWSLGHWVRRA
jgi:hypothetical protein